MSSWRCNLPPPDGWGFLRFSLALRTVCIEGNDWRPSRLQCRIKPFVTLHCGLREMIRRMSKLLFYKTSKRHQTLLSTTLRSIIYILHYGSSHNDCVFRVLPPVWASPGPETSSPPLALTNRWCSAVWSHRSVCVCARSTHHVTCCRWWCGGRTSTVWITVQCWSRDVLRTPALRFTAARSHR